MIDVVIFGAGIAGLWTLARLKKLGYQAILLENESLGSGQTGASQGIIHGGTKYALTGKLTHSSQAIGAMPDLWRECLAGQGEVDLSQVSCLSEHQYLWANKNIGARLAGFFAGKVMQSRMQTLKKSEYPDFFSSPNFQGDVYQLDEPVLDTFSLVSQLAAQYQENIFSFQVQEIKRLEGNTYRLQAAGQQIEARMLIFTAGNGNHELLQLAHMQQPQMQQRPLHQPMLKAAKGQLPLFFAHCLGASTLPRLTISAHAMGDEVIWYLGGEISETGVQRSSKEQIAAAKQELKSWIPWYSFEHCQWASYRVNRAEPKMPSGQRPVDPFVCEHENIISAWPVKLAMAPIMADAIVKQVQKAGIKQNSDKAKTDGLKAVTLTKAPWEMVKQWQ